MAKNIDLEIRNLLDIKAEVDQIKIAMISGKVVAISARKYMQLASDNLLDEDMLYYIVDPTIGQYIEGYVDIEVKA